MSGLTWIQTVWHTDGTPERYLVHVVDFKNNQPLDDKKTSKIIQ